MLTPAATLGRLNRNGRILRDVVLREAAVIVRQERLQLPERSARL
jgi:hypothetical protein